MKNKKWLWLANVNTFTFSSLQILLFALIPLTAEMLGLSLASVIASFSAGSFLFLWSGPFWSARSDRWGRLQIMALGLAGLTVSWALLLVLFQVKSFLSPTLIFWGLMISRVIYGLMASAIVPVAQALHADLGSEQGLLKAMLSNSISLNLGRALGPVYVLLAGEQNMQNIFWYGMAIALVVLNINCLSLRNHRTSAPAKPDLVFSLSPTRKKSWLQDWAYLRGVLSLALLFTTFIGVLNSSLAAILQKKFFLEAEQASHFMAQLLLVSSLLALLVQKTTKAVLKNPWQGSLWLGASSLVLGSCFFLQPSSLTWIWAAIVFFSIGIALLPPSYLALMVENSGTGQGLGLRTGLMGTANTLGYAFGGLLTAVLLKWPVLSLEQGILLLTMLITGSVFWLYRERRQVAA